MIRVTIEVLPQGRHEKSFIAHTAHILSTYDGRAGLENHMAIFDPAPCGDPTNKPFCSQVEGHDPENGLWFLLLLALQNAGIWAEEKGAQE